MNTDTGIGAILRRDVSARRGLMVAGASNALSARLIEQLGFEAVYLTGAGITNTFGGIAVNEHAQALTESGAAIAGLYAAGGATGGLEGGPEIGYVGGLVKCGVTGLRAAEHIASLPS